MASPPGTDGSSEVKQKQWIYSVIHGCTPTSSCSRCPGASDFRDPSGHAESAHHRGGYYATVWNQHRGLGVRMCLPCCAKQQNKSKKQRLGYSREDSFPVRFQLSI